MKIKKNLPYKFCDSCRCSDVLINGTNELFIIGCKNENICKDAISLYFKKDATKEKCQ